MNTGATKRAAKTRISSSCFLIYLTRMNPMRMRAKNLAPALPARADSAAKLPLMKRPGGFKRRKRGPFGRHAVCGKIKEGVSKA